MNKNIEKYNLNYGFTTLLVFYMNLKYNNSREIKCSVLKKYPIFLLKELNKYLHESHYITMINECNDLNDFLEANKKIFTIKYNYVYINENISTNDIYEMLKKYNCSFLENVMYIMKNNSSINKIIKFDGIKNKIMKLLHFEESIFENYLIYKNKLYNKDLSNESISIYNYLTTVRDRYYRDLLNSALEYLENYMEELLTFNNIDHYKCFFPLDKSLDYNKLTPEYNESAQSMKDLVFLLLCNPYLYSIFLDLYNPSIDKVDSDFQGLYGEYVDLYYVTNQNIEFEKFKLKRITNKMLNNEKNIYSIISSTERLLYLKYIKCIEEIEEKYGIEENLETSKYRLIYLLDSKDDKLLIDGNIDKLYNELLKKYKEQKHIDYDNLTDEEYIEMDFIDIEYYQPLIKAIILDLFEGQLYDNILEFKKLALVKSYYEITKDEEIILFWNEYSDNINFWEYNNYIKGNTIDLVRRK